MRCPQCNYNGERVDGGCARCGFGRMQMAQTALNVSRYHLSHPGPVSLSQSSHGIALRQGRYRLTKRVALPENQKNQGVAWVALDTSLHRQVVIRELPLLQSTDVQKIHLAATRLDELSKQQPAIPAVLDLFQEQENAYIVLEEREGNSLALLMQYQEGRLPERMLAEYGRQLCDVISALSSSHPSFVHGSISPSTILISPDGADASFIHFPIFQPGELPARKLPGHPGYLAPEQVHGLADPSSDLYSLAATLYHAVTGSSPVDRVAFFYPPARRLNPDVTEMMEAILTRGLQTSPADRYSYPAAMQQDLTVLLASYADPEVEQVASSAYGEILILNSEQMREHYRSNNLLDIGVVASIVVLFLVALLFFLLR